MKHLTQLLMAIIFGTPTAIFYYTIGFFSGFITTEEQAWNYFFLSWIVASINTVILFVIFKLCNTFAEEQTSPKFQKGRIE